MAMCLGLSAKGSVEDALDCWYGGRPAIVVGNKKRPEPLSSATYIPRNKLETRGGKMRA